jgi:hypothetical protein
MSDKPKKPPVRGKPGAAPRSKDAGEAGKTIPRRTPHSYGQSAEMPDTPDIDPRTVEAARKPVASDDDSPKG